MNLFEEENDSEGDEAWNQLTINKSYAKVYDDIRAGEELNKLKTKYGDLPIHQLKGKEEESSSESSESEDEGLELDLDFLKTLSALKSKDPKIYDAQSHFFAELGEEKGEEENEDDKESTSTSKRSKDKKYDKPMFLKDYERETILAGGKFDEDEEEEDENEEKNGGRPMSPSYAEEQRKIKESFKMALDDEDDENDKDEEETGTASFLKKKVKTKEEKEKEENDFKEWLLKNDDKEEEAKASSEEHEKKDLSGLKAYWNQPNLGEGEKFLKDFLLSKKYLVDEDDEGEENEEGGKGGERSSEGEEEEMDRLDEFETKFNFRFQEPDADVVKSYPRTIQETVRKEARSRKEKRDAREERKKEEKQKVIEELNLLKELKQKEILSKVEQLRKISGKEKVEGADPINDEYFDKDFDPEEHDAMVAKMFDDDYYEGAGAAEDEKLPGPPPLPTDGIAAAVLEELATDQDNWDEWDGGKDQEGEEGEQDPDDADDSLAAGAISDFLQSERASKPTSRKEKRQRQKEKKKSLFKKAIEKEKPVFDPQLKSFDEYIEEYYKLNFEDVIDKTPVRFKYRNVQANSFGLSTEEILAARDKELNQWASIKKASQYRTDEEEHYDLKAFEAKGKNAFKKKQVLKSLFEEQEQKMEEEKTDTNATETGKTEEEKDSTTTASTSTALNDDSMEGGKKNKKKQNGLDGATIQGQKDGFGFCSEISSSSDKPSLSVEDKDSTKTAPTSTAANNNSSTGAKKKKKGKKKKQNGLDGVNILKTGLGITILDASSVPSVSSLSCTPTSPPESTAQPNFDSKKKRRKKKRKSESMIASDDSPAKKKAKVVEGKTEGVGDQVDGAEIETEEVGKQKSSTTEDSDPSASSATAPSSAKKRRKQKKKRSKEGSNETASASGAASGCPSGGSKNFISESRLKAYDINPKKFQRFQKYGKTAKSRADGTFVAE